MRADMPAKTVEQMQQDANAADAPQTQHSVEDVIGMLDTLMLLSALLLAFAVNMQTGTFDRETLQDADLHYMEFNQGSRGYEKLEDQFFNETDTEKMPWIVSFRLFTEAAATVSCLSFSLMAAAFTYFALSYSNAREDEEAFKHFFSMFKYLIFFSVLSLLGGIILFYRVNQTSVDIMYPIYGPTTYYNATTRTLEEVDPFEQGKLLAKDEYWDKRFYYNIQFRGGTYMSFTMWGFALFGAACVVMYIRMMWKSAKVTAGGGTKVDKVLALQRMKDSGAINEDQLKMLLADLLHN